MGQGYVYRPQGIDEVVDRLRQIDRRTTAMRSAGNPTTPPTVTTGAAGGVKVTVPGLVSGTSTDNGPMIQAVLDGLSDQADAYDHSKTVWVEGPYGAPVYINSSVRVETSHVNLHFASTVLFGPYGRVRIQGEVAELPDYGKPVLRADYTAGSATLIVSDTALFTANDYVIIRGARGATGDPLPDQKEFGYIASVDSATQLTLVEPFESDYMQVNANPDAPNGTSPESQLTKVVAANLTVDAARGDRVVTVDTTAIFTVGDTVQIMDDARTTNSTTGLPEVDNFIHREMAQIVEILSATQLRLSHALHHPCEVAQRGKVVLVYPARGSSITNMRARWTAMSEVGVAAEIRFGVSCRMIDCEVTGTGVGTTGRATASWLNQAFRITDSLYCATIGCRASRPANTSGGKGYGFTLYGSNGCRIQDCVGTSLRHTVLLFNSAAGNTISNVYSEDVCLSDFDAHGCGVTDNLFTNCIAVGGESLASNGDSNRAAVRIGNTAHRDGDYWNTFDGIVVVNFHDGAAIDFVAQSHSNVIRNVTAINCLTGVRARPTPADTTLEITNNVVEGLTTYGVTNITDINGGTSVVVKGLVIKDSTFNGATGNVRPQNAERVEFRRCDWVEPAQPSGIYALWATNVEGLVVSDCDVSRSQRGVKLTDCVDARVVYNRLHDLVSTQVLDDGGGNTNALFRRNEIHGFTPTFPGAGTSTGFTVDTTT
jgi:hypothetical protein